MVSEKLNKLHGDLASGDETRVISALEALRTDGNIHTIPAVVKALRNTESEPIRNSLTHFLFDLKSEEALPALLGTIIDPDNAAIQTILVSACWESGLDCTKYLEFFVDLALRSEYMVCLECLTVIENLPGPFDQSLLEKCIVKTADAMDEDDEGKFELLNGIWEVLVDFRATFPPLSLN